MGAPRAGDRVELSRVALLLSGACLPSRRACEHTALCTPATPKLRARSPHVAGARSLGDGGSPAAALGVRAGIGARARLPPAGFCQTGTRVGARGAGEAQPATRRAAGLMPMAGHDRPSDRWTAVRGTCRRLPDDRPRRSPGVDLEGFWEKT